MSSAKVTKPSDALTPPAIMLLILAGVGLIFSINGLVSTLMILPQLEKQVPGLIKKLLKKK